MLDLTVFLRIVFHVCLATSFTIIVVFTLLLFRDGNNIDPREDGDSRRYAYSSSVFDLLPDDSSLVEIIALLVAFASVFFTRFSSETIIALTFY